MKSVLKIAGNTVMGITSYNLKLSDFDAPSSGRNDAGKMIRDRIRKDVASIDLTVSNLTTSQMNEFTSWIASSSFSVEFLYAGSWKSVKMYCGDRSISLLNTSKNFSDVLWTVSVTLVEF